MSSVTVRNCPTKLAAVKLHAAQNGGTIEEESHSFFKLPLLPNQAWAQRWPLEAVKGCGVTKPQKLALFM